MTVLFFLNYETHLHTKAKRVLRRLHAGESKKALSKEFNVDTKTSRRWIENKEFINELDACGKHKQVVVSVSSAELEERCWEFLCQCRQRRIVVTGSMVCSLAQEMKDLKIDHFKASEGCLQKFKNRHQIQAHSICGEANSLNIKVLTIERNKFPKLLKGIRPIIYVQLRRKRACFTRRLCRDVRSCRTMTGME